MLAQLPGASVFDEVEENPSTTTCERGGAECRKAGCDFVVALGGGSPMDAAKAIAVLARNPGRCADFFGTDKYAEPNLPVITIPTTSGTGSEVTPYAVITDVAEEIKRTVSGRGLFPVTALLDPELAATMPSHVTANTGLDALSQVMEGMVSKSGTPKGDTLALEGCRIIREWLPRAVADGQDLEARERMMYAAMLSGCVIAQSGTTLVHGLGYYLTSVFGLAHGLANAVLLAPVFRYNAQHEPEKVAAIATALGFPAKPTPENASEQIVEALQALMHDVGVSSAAKDAGVTEEDLKDCANSIYGDRSRFKNQVGEPTLEEVLGFFLQAHAGFGG